MSTKKKNWVKFSEKVERHIETYVVPQYGDDGDDIATEYTFEECILNLKRYIARAGKNSRAGQNELDMIKIAHYAQMAHNKINGEQNAQG